MNNILRLCQIFGCNINHLVNENLIDLDSLDEEIKMKVVKFKKEKQQKMKGISKAIYVMARIAKIIMWIPIITVALLVLMIPMIASGINMTDTKIELFGENYIYQIDDQVISVVEEKTGKST